MSLFRKPKKIQRRVFCADDDDDADPEVPPPPVISSKKENKPIKSKTLLSFGDEVEDGEVFQVKKSSQSKRLAKKRDKEKKKGPECDNSNKNDFSNHEIPQEISLEKPKKKKVSLEGLILSGRAALAAGGSDAETSGSGASEPEGDGGFHTYRADSVRAALKPGHIPDAALIHAARKTRQQARELGDFVPLRDSDEVGGVGGGRLAREEDDDDEDEGRILVRGLQLPSDKPERDTEAAEVESGGEEWEEQQLMKARTGFHDLTGEGQIPLNPFSLCVPPPPPPPPRLEGHLRPLAQLQPNTAQDLILALRQRVSELQEERAVVQAREDAARARLLAALHVRRHCQARLAPLDRLYRRAQAARSYCTDLVECLDEKMPELEALEARALALQRRGCELLVERRRADVRDQAHDVLAIAGRAGCAKLPEDPDKVRRTAEREGRRRTRRLARTHAHAHAHTHTHRDGDSSDDELPTEHKLLQQQERESIRAASAALFADAGSAWRSVRGVCARVAAWRRHSARAYSDAHVAACLPRLLAPYVRHQLILWNPLAEEDNDDYERMDWYKTLMMYGVKPDKLSDDSDSDEPDEDVVVEVTEKSVREDLDLMLVPTIITKVVLPKLTELVENAWDPMSVRSCVRLRQLLVRAAALPPGPGSPGPASPARPALRSLAAAVRARLAATISADVFLPTLPPHVVEGPGGVFWRRMLGAGVRLLRGVHALAPPPPVLHAHVSASRVLDSLCMAAGAAPGPAAATACVWLAEALPRGTGGTGGGGGLRAQGLQRIAVLARTALSRLESDNPLHMKALEQVRAILAEAKACEE